MNPAPAVGTPCRRRVKDMPVDHAFLSTPHDFATVLADLQLNPWPPTEQDLDELAERCARLIAGLDAWGIATQGLDVIDQQHGPISTAQARRLLAREVAVGSEGDIAVMLIPRGERQVRVELRAFADPETGLLKQPEFVMDYEHQGEEYEHYVWLARRGAQWYMLAQLRDDLLEGRLEDT